MADGPKARRGVKAIGYAAAVTEIRRYDWWHHR
jgi:hypothetical protein